MELYWMSLGSLIGLIAYIQAIMPQEYRYALSRFGSSLFDYFSWYNHFEVHEIVGINSNQLYSWVEIYLSSSAFTSAQRATLCIPKNSKKINYSLANSGKVPDTFKGAQVWWQHISYESSQSSISFWSDRPDEKRYYTLQISKRDRDRVLQDYIDDITIQAKQLQFSNKEKQLYTNGSAKNNYEFNRKPWDSVPFEHPSTFSTLALDPAKKQEILNDLQEFMRGKEFYHRVGRSWKRGYLLYGPPGTGKSSMIAAIANFTGYDVYDLELTEVTSNAELRKLLIHTTDKSIIVIEDIDCSVNLSDRAKRKKEKKKSEIPGKQKEEDEESRVTLSGLLNFTDGLWSCCGSERIIIFTTNHIDKLDPALLRSGRMDMHIFMSHCTFPAFKVLAQNYLRISDDHELFPQIEAIIDTAMMTPADVSEILIKKRDSVTEDPTEALEALIEALKAAKDKPKVEEKGDFGEGSEGLETTDMPQDKIEEEVGKSLADKSSHAKQEN